MEATLHEVGVLAVTEQKHLQRLLENHLQGEAAMRMLRPRSLEIDSL